MSIPTAHQTDSTSSFERLPAEVKDIIYREFLIAERPYVITDSGARPVWTGSRPLEYPDVALLRVNRSINAHTSEILYGENTWEFNIDQPHWAERFKYRVGPRNARHIRKLYAICDTPPKLMLLSLYYIEDLMFRMGTDLDRVSMLAIGFPCRVCTIPYHEYSRWQTNTDSAWFHSATITQVQKRLTLGSHCSTITRWFIHETPQQSLDGSYMKARCGTRSTRRCNLRKQ